jgi:hypothetical protein
MTAPPAAMRAVDVQAAVAYRHRLLERRLERVFDVRAAEPNSHRVGPDRGPSSRLW